MAPSAIAFEQWTCSMKRARFDTLRFFTKSRRSRSGTAFLADRGGTTMVEFAMIGVPFLGMLCAIFQTGLVYFEGAILQEATQVASRAILTQTAASGMTYGGFITSYVCPGVQLVLNCSNLQVDIQSVANWTGTGTTAASLDTGNFYNNANNSSSTVINMPAAGSIAVVRVMYPMS